MLDQNGKWVFGWGIFETESGDKINLKGKEPMWLVQSYGLKALTYVKTCKNNARSTEIEYNQQMVACNEAIDWYESGVNLSPQSGLALPPIDGVVRELPEVSLRKAMQTAPTNRTRLYEWEEWFRNLPSDLIAALR